MRSPHGTGCRKAGKKRGRYQRRDRPDTRAAAVQAVAYVLLRKLQPRGKALYRIGPEPASARETQPSPRARPPARPRRRS